MTFEEWFGKMRAERKVPFGAAYEVFARTAWEAAQANEREACKGIASDVADSAFDDEAIGACREVARRISARG